MNFDYNSTRSKLILAEYGRNVQNMVDHICTVESKDERNRLALVVIDMMGVLNPHLRDVSDFKHKLWDHLYIISDFKIDVDSPYPIPNKEEIRSKPEPLPYPQHRIRFKHYGHVVEQMIAKAITNPNEESRVKMTVGIANFMKMAYLTWNKDFVNDQQIILDLAELSGGILRLPDDTVLTKLDFRTPPPGSRVKGQATSSTSNNQKHSSSSNNYKKPHSGGGSNNMGQRKRLNNNNNSGSSNNNNNRRPYQSNSFKK